MSETPVLLTAELARMAAESRAYRMKQYGFKEDPTYQALEAIAIESTVCIEAERLARMEAALRYYACATTSPDFDNGIKAREALAAQEVGK